jgi:mono/diheme cytochrome c family protein
MRYLTIVILLFGSAYFAAGHVPSLAQQLDVSTEQEPWSAVLVRGAELYNAYRVSCHGGATGGNTMDMPPPHNANGHTWHHPDCQLIDSILNGSGQMEDLMRRMMGVPEDVPRMPAFREQLTEDDAAAVLAYIRTWWTDRQRESQARTRKALC